MKRWLQVWWHSLCRTLAKEPHRMCSLTYAHFGRVNFCECGYPDGPDSPFVRRINEVLTAARAAGRDTP